MPVPVLSVVQMREWEQATWAAGKTEAEVIAEVGRIVARRALELSQPGDAILALAGKGNNGADVRQAMPHLTGRMARLLDVIDPVTAHDELVAALKSRPALVIDGLFGIGLNRPLSEPWCRLIEQVNGARLRVLAVDGPSGLDAETGQTQGAAIRSTVTLTLGAPKRGLLAPGASEWVGRLEVAPEIGLSARPQRGEQLWTLPEDFAGYPPTRTVDAHKGRHGHLVIFAGSLGYHGAAVLAARGALRARPGLVTVYTMDNVYVPVASQLQAAMVHPWNPALALPGSCSAVLFGPGLAAPGLPPELRSELSQFWRDAAVPVIADASALDWLPEGQVRPEGVRLITPHPGEAARMLKRTTGEVQANRVEALRQLSRNWGGCWVVLKGHQSLVGLHAGEVYINSSGTPYLAQGGSGDVLAGYVGGLLAQPTLRGDALQAIRYAVWQHGAAADQLDPTRVNWTIDDLLEVLGAVR